MFLNLSSNCNVLLSEQDEVVLKEMCTVKIRR